MDILALNLIKGCLRNKIPELSLSGLGLGNSVFMRDNSVLKELIKCQHLISLNLSGNRLGNVDFLEKLPNLEILYISENYIENIGSIRDLSKLRHLDVSFNKLTAISGLEKLINLRSLNLSYNSISDIKNLRELLRGITPTNDNYYKELPHQLDLKVFSNPLITPPIEVVYRGRDSILSYFDDLEKRGEEYLYEAKMIVLGQPRAGKTSFAKKLMNEKSKLSSEDETTRGIDILHLNFPIKGIDGKDRTFFYNLWDFGGQQIYHTTHQFFLTHRTLYALIIDSGNDNLGNDDETVNYWLQIIEILGGSSPLLLIKNEKNGRKISIDVASKKARFNFLKEEYCIDLNALIPDSKFFNYKRLREFIDLKDQIETQLKHLPLVGYVMPKNWAILRNELKKLSIDNYFISKNHFIDLCISHQITEYEKQMQLSKIFHDLGVFLHFQDYDALDDLIILQNTWATDAVFAVLDNNKVQENKGVFSDKDLPHIWDSRKYQVIVHKKLLALMMQFKLCYVIDKSNHNLYIIPEMLSDAVPSDYSWSANNDLLLQYKYEFMPRGIITQFIVRMHKNIHVKNGEQQVWKTGVKIDGGTLGYPNTEAEVTEAWNSKELNIRSQGPFAKDLSIIISHEIELINNQYFRHVNSDGLAQNSKWDKMIPCNCVTCSVSIKKHFYRYNDLIKRKVIGKKTIECEKEPFATVNIAELLDGVVAAENIKLNLNKNISSAKKIFISYKGRLSIGKYFHQAPHCIAARRLSGSLVLHRTSSRHKMGQNNSISF